VHPDQTLELELASELAPAASPPLPAAPEARVRADVADLLTLAERLRRLPPIQPDRAWMEASKRRLLARFDAVQSGIERASATTATDGG
jgi:hypothetical protein